MPADGIAIPALRQAEKRWPHTLKNDHEADITHIYSLLSDKLTKPEFTNNKTGKRQT